MLYIRVYFNLCCAYVYFYLCCAHTYVHFIVLFCGLRLCYTVSHILITVMCMQLLHVLHVQSLSLAHNIMHCMGMYTYVPLW